MSESIPVPTSSTEPIDLMKELEKYLRESGAIPSTPNPPTGLVCVGTHDWKELGVEVCGKPAVTTDVDGEPLCRECLDACPDDDAREDSDGE